MAEQRKRLVISNFDNNLWFAEVKVFGKQCWFVVCRNCTRTKNNFHNLIIIRRRKAPARRITVVVDGENGMVERNNFLAFGMQNCGNQRMVGISHETIHTAMEVSVCSLMLEIERNNFSQPKLAEYFVWSANNLFYSRMTSQNTLDVKQCKQTIRMA